MISDEAKRLIKVFEKEGRKELKKVHPKLGDVAEFYFVTSKKGLFIEVAVPKYPWIWQLYGTKPHTICARLWKQCGRPSPLWPIERKAWALKIVKGSQVFFKRWVRHPGNKPLWQIKRGRERMERAFLRAWKEVFSQ